VKPIQEISQNWLTNFAVRNGWQRAFNRPFYIFLEVTNRCNLACIMCGRTHDPRYEIKGHTGDLTLERVKRLDSFYPHATFTIPTGVGEPFINLELVPIIKYLKSRGTQVSLTSNGTILNKIHSTEMIQCGLDKIIFSIDGATQQTFERIRVNARFNTVIGNVARLKELKAQHQSPFPRVELELVAMACNFHELPAWAEMAKELGAEALTVQNLFGHSGEVFGDIYDSQKLIHIAYSQGNKIWEEFLDTARRLNLQIYSPYLNADMRQHFGPDPVAPERMDAGSTSGRDRLPDHADIGAEVAPAAGTQAAPPRQAEKTTPMYCTQPWSILFMAWNGDIRTCCFNEYALGNITGNSIEKIWNGPKYRSMRKAVAAGKVMDVCRDCLSSGSNYSIIPELDMSLPSRHLRAALQKNLIRIKK